VSDAVRDGETGILVDPEHPEDIAAAVRQLLDDSRAASDLGAAGRRAVERYYNWDRVAADVAAIGRECGRSGR